MSRYSSTDLDCILGSQAVDRKRKKALEVSDEENEAEEDSSMTPMIGFQHNGTDKEKSDDVTEKEHGLVTIKRGSMNAYFAEKMAALKAKRDGTQVKTETKENVETDETDDKIVSKKIKSKRESLLQTTEEKEGTVVTELEIDTQITETTEIKKRKKAKKSKSDKDETDLDKSPKEEVVEINEESTHKVPEKKKSKRKDKKAKSDADPVTSNTEVNEEAVKIEIKEEDQEAETRVSEKKSKKSKKKEKVIEKEEEKLKEETELQSEENEETQILKKSVKSKKEKLIDEENVLKEDTESKFEKCVEAPASERKSKKSKKDNLTNEEKQVQQDETVSKTDTEIATTSSKKSKKKDTQSHVEEQSTETQTNKKSQENAPELPSEASTNVEDSSDVKSKKKKRKHQEVDSPNLTAEVAIPSKKIKANTQEEPQIVFEQVDLSSDSKNPSVAKPAPLVFPSGAKGVKKFKEALSDPEVVEKFKECLSDGFKGANLTRVRGYAMAKVVKEPKAKKASKKKKA